MTKLVYSCRKRLWRLFEKSLVAIKGPLETPVGGGIRSLNVALRQELDLYACVRPIRYFEGVASPLKNQKNKYYYLPLENTERCYAGMNGKRRQK